MRELRRLRPPSGSIGEMDVSVSAAVPPSGAPCAPGFRGSFHSRPQICLGRRRWPFPGVPPQMLAHTSICDSAPKSKQMKGTKTRRRFDAKPPRPPPRFRAALPGRRHPVLTKTGTVSSVHLSICLSAALCQRATTAAANYANGCSDAEIRSSAAELNADARMVRSPVTIVSRARSCQPAAAAQACTSRH